MPRPYDGESDVLMMDTDTMWRSLCADRHESLPTTKKHYRELTRGLETNRRKSVTGGPPSHDRTMYEHGTQDSPH